MRATIFNISSNAVARIWEIFLLLICVPIFINLVGVEAYGLIGFYATLFSSLKVLDLGLSRTITREVAMRLSSEHSSENLRNLIKSLEIVYLLIGTIIGILILFSSNYISENVLNSDELSSEAVFQSISLMGLIFIFQWPKSLYGGGIMGMQKHTKYNFCIILFSTIQYIGAIILMKYLSDSIVIFFIWQLISTILMIFSLRFTLLYYLPKSDRKALFSLSELKTIWRFAIGMTGVSLTAFFWTQLDKVILSKMVSLKEFGYYTIAWTIGTSTLVIVNFMGNVFFPKLSALVASKSNKAHNETFHLYNWIIISAILPISLIMCFCSKDLLWIWLRDHEIVESIHLAVSLLIGGTILSGINFITLNYLLALGETKFIIFKNLIAMIMLVPILIWSIMKYGIIGGSSIWLGINLINVFIVLPLVHRLYFKSVSLKETLISDILIPVSISIGSIFILTYIFRTKLDFSIDHIEIVIYLIKLLAAPICTYLLLILSKKRFRSLLKGITKRVFVSYSNK